MRNKTAIVTFRADVLGGDILVIPKTFYLNCDGIQILGMQNFKDFDANQCIIEMKCLAIMYGGVLMGNRDFTVDSFISYRNTQCACCSDNDCNVLVGDCEVMIGNCSLTI